MNYNQQGYNYQQTGFQQETLQKKKGGCFVKGLKILGIAFAAFLVLIIVISIVLPDESGSGTTTPDTSAESSLQTPTTTTKTDNEVSEQSTETKSPNAVVYPNDDPSASYYDITMSKLVEEYRRIRVEQYKKEHPDGVFDGAEALIAEPDYDNFSVFQTEDGVDNYEFVYKSRPFSNGVHKNLADICITVDRRTLKVKQMMYFICDSSELNGEGGVEEYYIDKPTAWLAALTGLSFENARNNIELCERYVGTHIALSDYTGVNESLGFLWIDDDAILGAEINKAYGAVILVNFAYKD